MIRLRALLGSFVLALIVAACSTELRHKTDVDTSRQALTSDTVCNIGASDIAVAPRWTTTMVGTYSRSHALEGAVRNNLDDTVDARVVLRAHGFAGHTYDNVIWEGQLAAGVDTFVSATLDDVPLRSEASPIEVELVVELVDVAEYPQLQVPSRPLFLLDLGSSGFAVTSETEATAPIFDGPAPSTMEEALVPMWNVLDERRSSRNEYLDPVTGNWSAIDFLGDQLHERDVAFRLDPGDSIKLAGLLGASDPPAIDTDFAEIRVCPRWPARFVDDGFGESFGSPFVASHAHAVIAEPGEVEPVVWQGFLDKDGCSPPLPLKDHTEYIAALTTTFKATSVDPSEQVEAIVQDASFHPVTTVASFFTMVVRRPAGQPDVNIHLGPLGIPVDSTRVAAVVSAALRREASRMAPGLYTINADKRCRGGGPGSGTACYDPDAKTLFIGPIDFDKTHNSLFKFVVAHELGHAVQDMAGAMPRSTAGSLGSASNSTVCGCAFVADPTDRSHCLQSKEEIGVAEVEGFGHYFATRVWNDDNPETCTFVYYKNFKTGGLVQHPPLVRSCTAEVQWLKTRCPESGRGVEHDWMNFQRALGINAYPIALNDLLDIYRMSCGTASCDTVEPTFVDLRSATQLKYGTNSDEALKFDDTGASYGVDQ